MPRSRSCTPLITVTATGRSRAGAGIREPPWAHQPALRLDLLRLVTQLGRRGGLVEHEQPGFLGEGPREPDTLVLAPGQRPQQTVRQIRRVARQERPLDGRAVLRAHAAQEGEVRVATEQRSEEHTSELQSQSNLVCRLLLEKK